MTRENFQALQNGDYLKYAGNDPTVLRVMNHYIRVIDGHAVTYASIKDESEPTLEAQFNDKDDIEYIDGIFAFNPFLPQPNAESIR